MNTGPDLLGLLIAYTALCTIMVVSIQAWDAYWRVYRGGK